MADQMELQKKRQSIATNLAKLNETSGESRLSQVPRGNRPSAITTKGLNGQGSQRFTEFHRQGEAAAAAVNLRETLKDEGNVEALGKAVPKLSMRQHLKDNIADNQSKEVESPTHRMSLFSPRLISQREGSEGFSSPRSPGLSPKSPDLRDIFKVSDSQKQAYDPYQNKLNAAEQENEDTSATDPHGEGKMPELKCPDSPGTRMRQSTTYRGAKNAQISRMEKDLKDLK